MEKSIEVERAPAPRLTPRDAHPTLMGHVRAIAHDCYVRHGLKPARVCVSRQLARMLEAEFEELQTFRLPAGKDGEFMCMGVLVEPADRLRGLWIICLDGWRRPLEIVMVGVGEGGGEGLEQYLPPGWQALSSLPSVTPAEVARAVGVLESFCCGDAPNCSRGDMCGGLLAERIGKALKVVTS